VEERIADIHKTSNFREGLKKVVCYQNPLSYQKKYSQIKIPNDTKRIFNENVLSRPK